MKFNFRKIASVIASAVMLGSTAGMALAANYPQPFVVGGAADAAIVVTSGTHAGAVSDYDAAISAQTALQGLVTSTTSTTGASTSGGDSVNLATSSTKLYINSNLSQARSVITNQHLPTILADGIAEDNSGTQYKYTQKIVPGVDNANQRRVVTFGKSGESIDPIPMVDIGYTAANPVYNYTLTMQKTINASSTNVQGYAKIKLLGQEYTVGANSDSAAAAPVLYLYGAGTSVVVKGGETQKVTVEGKEHSVTLVTTSSSTAGTIEVNGLRKDVSKGSSYKFAGDIEVYIKSVVHPTVQGDPRDIEVLVGAKTLHLTSGQNVRYGSDDTAILGTNAYIGASGGNLASITISEASASSAGDYLAVGDKFTDRVFSSLELQFASLNPALDSTARDAIKVDGDNSANVYVEFTSALKTDSSKRIAFAHDIDGVGDATLNQVRLADANNNTIHVLEGEAAKVNEFVVVNSNDEGRILQVKALPTGTSSTDYIQLDDVVSGETFKFTTGYLNYTASAQAVGGGEYLASISVNSDSAQSTVCINWGASAVASPNSCANSTLQYGTQRTLFPRIKLKNGEWMAFLAETNLTNATTYSMPGLYTKTDYESGAAISKTGGTTAAEGKVFGRVNYTFIAEGNGSLGLTLNAIDANNDGTADCIFNRTLGPAILVQEEKTDAATNGNAICIPLTRVGTNTIVPGPSNAGPYATDGTLSMTTLTSNSYKSQGVSLFGTFAERDTSSGTAYSVVLKYPDEQMYADVLFTSVGTTVTPGSSTSGGGVISIVKDTEIDTVKDKNLLVVGGSCINTVAAKVLNVAEGTCGADFTTATTVDAGKYLIKAIASPYNAAKTAVLVAGYEAAETGLAVAKLKETHATTTGTSEIYPKVTA